jgi:KDO2-lipid IV(A) lauroyltransferase
MNFFGKRTPFIPGPERGARAGNIPVVFASIYKVKRGYYRFELTLISKNPAELPAGELSRKYRDFLENFIREHPDNWLWTHRRWKHEWKEEYAGLWID